MATNAYTLNVRGGTLRAAKEPLRTGCPVLIAVGGVMGPNGEPLVLLSVELRGPDGGTIIEVPLTAAQADELGQGLERMAGHVDATSEEVGVSPARWPRVPPPAPSPPCRWRRAGFARGRCSGAMRLHPLVAPRARRPCEARPAPRFPASG